MMSEIPVRFTADDWKFSFVLRQKNGNLYPIEVGAVITATVTTSDDNSAESIVPVEVASDVAPGADWPNSRVTVIFPRANTNVTDYGSRYVELQIEQGGLKETFKRKMFTLKKGVLA